MMGANIQISNVKTVNGEVVGNIDTESSSLNGIKIPKELIASSIDELPLLFWQQAKPMEKLLLEMLKELRVKESDRISSMIKMMERFNISTDEFPDGMNIYGGKLKETKVNSFGDHRIAMTALLASLVSDGDIIVEDTVNIDTSFPEFIDIANNIGMDIKKMTNVITIDGPSGVGKGTISEYLSDELKWNYLNSGALYRAIAWVVK